MLILSLARKFILACFCKMFDSLISIAVARLNARRRLRKQAASTGYASSGKMNRSTTLAGSAVSGDPNRQIQIYQETFKVASDDHTMSAISHQKGIETMIEEPVEMVKVKHVL